MKSLYLKSFFLFISIILSSTLFKKQKFNFFCYKIIILFFFLSVCIVLYKYKKKIILNFNSKSLNIYLDFSNREKLLNKVKKNKQKYLKLISQKLHKNINADYLWLGLNLNPLNFEKQLIKAANSNDNKLKLMAAQELGLKFKLKYFKLLSKLSNDKDILVSVAACESIILNSNNIDIINKFKKKRINIYNNNNQFTKLQSKVINNNIKNGDIFDIIIKNNDLKYIINQIPLKYLDLYKIPEFNYRKIIYRIKNKSSLFFSGKIRLKGLIDRYHFRVPIKSFKIKTDKTDFFIKNNAYYLNSWYSDPYLQDYYNIKLFKLVNIPFYNLKMVYVNINNKKAGIHFGYENYDEFYLKKHNLPIGNIYSEKKFFKLRNYSWYQLKNINTNWSNKIKNTNKNFYEIDALLRVINTIPDKKYLKKYLNLIIDLNNYIKWYSVCMLLGNIHMYEHNYMFYFNSINYKLKRLPYDMNDFNESFYKSINIVLSPISKFIILNNELNNSKNKILFKISKKLKEQLFLYKNYKKDILYLKKMKFKSDLKLYSKTDEEKEIEKYKDIWTKRYNFILNKFDINKHLSIIKKDNKFYIKSNAEFLYNIDKIIFHYNNSKIISNKKIYYKPEFIEDKKIVNKFNIICYESKYKLYKLNIKNIKNIKKIELFGFNKVTDKKFVLNKYFK